MIYALYRMLDALSWHYDERFPRFATVIVDWLDRRGFYQEQQRRELFGYGGTLYLSKRDYDALLEGIKNPPPPNERMIAAAEQYKRELGRHNTRHVTEVETRQGQQSSGNVFADMGVPDAEKLLEEADRKIARKLKRDD